MRTISLNISLEDYCSRLPGVVPAYEDNILYYFDTDSLESDFYRHKSNYSMFPLNVVLSGVSLTTKYDDWALEYTSQCGIAKLSSSSDCSKYVTLDWHHISDIFAFFRNYYSLLNDYSSCGLAYSSATDYYTTEMKSKYATTLLFGNDADTYTEFDQRFERYGGIVSSITYSDIHEDYKEATGYEHEPIVHSFDIGFFKWLCDNIVPIYAVPKDYIDAYESKILFYPDVVYWYGWLQRMNKKYTGDTPTCEDYTMSVYGEKTCCECEKYIKMGSTAMLSNLKAWLEEINARILKNNALFKNNLDYKCQNPVIFADISLLNSVEDMGEFAILSEEWEGGVNYAPNTEYTNITAGTVVIYNDNAYIMHDEKHNDLVGYKYDNRFCEYVWGNDDALIYIGNDKNYKTDKTSCWQDYLEYRLVKDSTEFTSKTTTYAYNSTGKRINDPTPLSMAETVDFNTNDGLGYILFEGETYSIFQNESVIYSLKSNPYLKDKVFIVNRETDTNTPYVEINGRKIYAIFNDNGQYQFYFNQDVNFKKSAIDDANLRYFVNINGTTYLIEDSKITYYFDEYQQTFAKIDGWFTYNNTVHYVLNNKIVESIQTHNSLTGLIENTFDGDSSWYAVDLSKAHAKAFAENMIYYQISGDTVLITQYYTEKPANYITGITTSKIESVKSEELYYDDLGNVMNGYHEVTQDANYAQPYEGELLAPYYNVGNAVSLVEAYTNNNVQYYTGNIIESMEFYYLNIDGTRNSCYACECNLNNRKNSLTALKYMEGRYNYYLDSDDETVLDNILYCDIKYNIGATLYYVSNSTSKGWNINTSAHTGVEYSETVIFTKQQEQYYLSEDKSYNVFCYILGQETHVFDSTDYDTSFEIPCAYFKMQICTLNSNLDGKIFTPDNGFKANNGMMIAPIFKQEYMLNVSQPEYVESNINIDRGNNSAFEKHIKLGEVSKFEALENYGNGFFNMLDT